MWENWQFWCMFNIYRGFTAANDLRSLDIWNHSIQLYSRTFHILVIYWRVLVVTSLHWVYHQYKGQIRTMSSNEYDVQGNPTICTIFLLVQWKWTYHCWQKISNGAAVGTNEVTRNEDMMPNHGVWRNECEYVYIYIYPICSMYRIYTYIWDIYRVNDDECN